MPLILGIFRPSEIVIVIAAAAGIAAIARRRGGRAEIWGPVAGLGYFVLRYAVVKMNLFQGPSLQDETFNLGQHLTSIGWMLAVALAARFLIGRGRGAGESWFCPGCQTYNPSDASHCQACGQAFPKAE
jgi:hypothetical protein